MANESFYQIAKQVIASGGWIMIPIFLLGFMAFYICGRMALYFFRYNHRKTSIAQCEAWVKNPNEAKGQIGDIIRYAQAGSQDISDIQSRFAEIRTAEVPRLQQNVGLLQIFINTAPLLGLLGTVLGMLHTFYGISLGGNESTTSIVASGIQEALITTQMGLTLAIPGYVMVYYLKQKIIDFETFLVRLESMTLQSFQTR